MLQLINKTSLPAAMALFPDQHGEQRLSVAIKATFSLPAPGEAVKLAQQQHPILLADEYFGDPACSALRYPADLTPYKPATDIGLNGHAHSPDGYPVKKLRASLGVGKLKKTVQVYGARFWYKHTLKFHVSITEPQPFNKVPLRYEYAFGGSDAGESYALNPLGMGFLQDKQKAHGTKLPYIEDPHHLITKPSLRPPAAGFGFIPPAWEQRRVHGGTYDETWRRNQFPLPPVDFDSRFYNAAAPGLVTDGYLKGGEPVHMVNLSRHGELAFDLPRLAFTLTFRLFGIKRQVRPDIWTVVFEPDEERFMLTWGAVLETEGQAGQVRDVLLELDKTRPTGVEGL